MPLLLLAVVLCAQAQTRQPDQVYRSPVRKILNKFSVNFSAGYGITRYAHNLDGFFLVQNDSLQLLVPVSPERPGRLVSGSVNWFNNPGFVSDLVTSDNREVPDPRLPNPVNNPLLQGAEVFNADSLGLSYVGIGHSVPFNLSLHLNIFKFRIGGGLQYEAHWVRPLKPSEQQTQIRKYTPDFKTAGFFRYYGMIGYQFYDWWDYTFAAELQIGQLNLGRQFNSGAVSNGLYTNFGIVIEDNWSEYFRVTLKPGIDFKSYSVTLPDGATLKHNQHAFYLQVGVSINLPEIPRSPIPGDKIQLKHIITNPKSGKRMEVRGQPFWKVQSPKVGQNHKKVLRRKGKNKKKFNPF